MPDSEITPKLPAVEILRSWKAAQEDQLRATAEIIRDSITIDDLQAQLTARSWTCGVPQFLGPLFKNLYPQIRPEVLSRLRNLGLNEQNIDEYFLRFGDNPSYLFSLNHEGEFSREVLNSFGKTANQLMLDKLKEILF